MTKVNFFEPNFCSSDGEEESQLDPTVTVYWWIQISSICFGQQFCPSSGALDCTHVVVCCRVQLKRDGTQWRTGGEVKGKVANGVGNQYPSLPWNMLYPALLPLMRTPRLPVVDWTDATADLNGLVRFAERQNLVSARVPSHFKRSLPNTLLVGDLVMRSLTSNVLGTTYHKL
jgi:hypothetical protein